MGRGKIEIKRIEDRTNRQVTFSKRRTGLLKKAHELSILCDAQLGLIVFSSSGKMYEYSNPPSSMSSIIERYQGMSSSYIPEYPNVYNDENLQRMCWDMRALKLENDRLEANLKTLRAEDLSNLDSDQLQQVEEQLECSLSRVRAERKQLLKQQMESQHKKGRQLVDENNYISSLIRAHEARREHYPALFHQLGSFYEHGGESSQIPINFTPHQHEFRLQPTQPNLQEACIQHLGLNL
ncbi:MADS-box protein GGM13 [Amborella trichopoda]|uniref:MADS-box protein GGM13 n=1 Tax=Amborella trichopoda TaxID=13333 RepID=UPI0009C19F23|nr:MADS-box protein GGM13 [Amborella trichopoda]XP_020520176.1 MADS-box protein GGM13 [Amborella trichopoda]|eukprot:XP_020520175.1 MADS-box protein GGM13 [Amborella trichopoda]